MVKRTPAVRCVGVLIALGLVWLVVSCGGDESGGFASVDSAVSDSRIAEIGRIVSDTRTGSAGTLGQAPTRVVTVLSSVDANKASTQLSAALGAAGFEQQSESLYQRSRDGKTVLAFVAVHASGTTVEGVPGPVPAGQSVLAVTFTESR